MQNEECSPVKWRADFAGQGMQNENSRLNGSYSPFCILSPKEREKCPLCYDPLWRWDIPSDGLGTLSFGERVG